MSNIIAQTQRLFLRELTMEDFDALYAVLADSDMEITWAYGDQEDAICLERKPA